ncbi:hypothetical protein ACPA0F_18415 [Solibacillus silvestris]
MNNVDQLADYLKMKFMAQEVTGTELVVALMAMIKDGRINETDMRNILLSVFNNNIEGIVRSLNRANKILDNNLLVTIVNDVRKALP